MKFSIILPVKNGGDYLKACVQSILAQTYIDFNLHILENQSNDGTAQWLQTLNDERIEIIPSEKSLGIEKNWARIISINKNEFITIIGHDDLFEKDYLQTMHDLIQQHPNASLYQTHFKFIDAKGNFIKACKPMDEKQTAAEFLRSLFTHAIDTMGTGYMMRSKDYNAVGGIPSYPNLLFADHALWIKLTALNYKVTSPKECFLYRHHENLSKNSDAVRYINAFYNYMDFLIELKKTHTEIAVTIEEYISAYIFYYCRALAHRLLKASLNERKQMTVSGFINNCIHYNKILSNNKKELEVNRFNIRAAKIIDSNALLRNLYLSVRRIYKKPLFK